MISRIRGILKSKNHNSVIVDVQGIHYEIFLPSFVMRTIDGRMAQDGMVELITYHYLEASMSRSHPVLIGFSHQIEKEFFERFITVSGIGPKAALKALTLPVSQIALAIDEGNLGFLKSLPGIGEQKARQIVAKLQGKVGKFGLIQEEEPLPKESEDLQSEAIEILMQLQYKKSEAKNMVIEAIGRNPNISTAEELLNEVYKQRRR